MRHVELCIGQIVVSKEPMMLGTILGSCVAVCLYDDILQVGGMNHYMLPWRSEEQNHRQGYHGPDSIEHLVRGVAHMGGKLRNMKAKVFGGGKVVRSFSADLDIGKRNIETARGMLAEFKIPVVREYTGTDCGLKVMFNTSTGKAFIREINNDTFGVEDDLEHREQEIHLFGRK